mmetsp:Transcript_24160/g.57122  ORF Transcript_24160/g.57122 Transcript_24160/m.57122 type:complete len:210 (-) Transcript_24160:868-1497(-)
MPDVERDGDALSEESSLPPPPPAEIDVQQKKNSTHDKDAAAAAAPPAAPKSMDEKYNEQLKVFKGLSLFGGRKQKQGQDKEGTGKEDSVAVAVVPVAATAAAAAAGTTAGEVQKETDGVAQSSTNGGKTGDGTADKTVEEDELKGYDGISKDIVGDEDDEDDEDGDCGRCLQQQEQQENVLSWKFRCTFASCTYCGGCGGPPAGRGSRS